jgi:hypothetical protein
MYFTTQKEALKFALSSIKSQHDPDQLLAVAQRVGRAIPGLRADRNVSAPSLRDRALGSTCWTVNDADLPKLRAFIEEFVADATQAPKNTPPKAA